MKKLAIVALAAVAASSAWAVKGTINTEKDQKTGDIVWQSRAKKYVLTYKKGPTEVQAEYPLSDVVSLDIPKPANFDAAVKGNNIPALKKIVQDYKMLTWDKPAGKALVKAYLTASPVNPQAAYDTARSIIADDDRAAYMGDLAPAYWQALLALGKTQQLENCLKKASTEGDRRSSAEALTMRGDVLAQADTPDAHRKALIDAYLRVALMYGDPECREARAEAMLRAATSFSKIGMAARAEDMKAMAQQVMAAQ